MDKRHRQNTTLPHIGGKKLIKSSIFNELRLEPISEPKTSNLYLQKTRRSAGQAALLWIHQRIDS
ncbi:hypothetical protein, partial [Cryobacterium sp. MLB-32]|uniref:hypothetical protein n=1 Tax=Cryobacterium sp. MLB-32 TaxID=1529318 RepID=UPI001E4D4829